MTAACPVSTLTRIQEGDWVVSRAEADPDACIRLAEANYRQEGNWKYVLEGPDDQLSLRLDELREQEEQDRSSKPIAAVGHSLAPIDATRLENMKLHLEALGYQCNSRADRIIVDLEQWHAEVAPEVDGGWLASVSFPAPAGENGKCREAVGLLLLRASGSVRIARGYLAEKSAGFAARFDAACSEEVMTASLNALATCCRYFAKSVSVLRNEEAAKAYLALNAISHSDRQKGNNVHA